MEVAVIVSLGLIILCIDVGYFVCVARSRLCQVEMIILAFLIVKWSFVRIVVR